MPDIIERKTGKRFFHSQLGIETRLTIRNLNAVYKQSIEYVLFVFYEILLTPTSILTILNYPDIYSYKAFDLDCQQVLRAKLGLLLRMLYHQVQKHPASYFSHSLPRTCFCYLTKTDRNIQLSLKQKVAHDPETIARIRH